MNHTLRVGAALATTAVLLGCRETTSSEFIRTYDIAALMDITAESESSSRVHVELRAFGAESGTYVVLHPGDRLSASAGDVSKDLIAVEEGVYEGVFATGEEVVFTIGLDRPEEQDAPGSEGTLPPPFALTSPVEEDELSRAEDAVAVVWSPAGDVEGTIEAAGDCIAPGRFEVSGAGGMFTIPKDTLKGAKGDEAETCTVELRVTFTRYGTADAALDEESYVRTHQVRTVSFTSLP